MRVCAVVALKEKWVGVSHGVPRVVIVSILRPWRVSFGGLGGDVGEGECKVRGFEAEKRGPVARSSPQGS